MNSSIKITPFGGNGGDPFSNQIIKEIGLRTGGRVDQIKINGNIHGGYGGTDLGSIILEHEEYINRVDIRSGEEVDYVKFSTNKGHSIGGGGNGGNPSTLENIRVMRIGGRSGARVDKLDIQYIENYQPSIVVERNKGFILTFTSPHQTFVEYKESREKRIDSYKRITENMMRQQYSASIEGEYYVKVTASTEIELKESVLTTVGSQLQNELNNSSQKTIKIEEGHIGILSVTGTLMKGPGPDDEFWMFPTYDPVYSVLDKTEIDGLLDHYDLTGELTTQMPILNKYKTLKNGYVYYGK